MEGTLFPSLFLSLSHSVLHVSLLFLLFSSLLAFAHKLLLNFYSCCLNNHLCVSGIQDIFFEAEPIQQESPGDEGQASAFEHAGDQGVAGNEGQASAFRPEADSTSDPELVTEEQYQASEWVGGGERRSSRPGKGSSSAALQVAPSLLRSAEAPAAKATVPAVLTEAALQVTPSLLRSAEAAAAKASVPAVLTEAAVQAQEMALVAQQRQQRDLQRQQHMQWLHKKALEQPPPPPASLLSRSAEAPCEAPPPCVKAPPEQPPPPPPAINPVPRSAEASSTAPPPEAAGAAGAADAAAGAAEAAAAVATAHSAGPPSTFSPAGPAEHVPATAAAAAEPAPQNQLAIAREEAAIVLRSAEQRVEALESLGVASRTHSMLVDGVAMSVSEVRGGEPAIWDLPQAAQIERLVNRQATLPGFDSTKPAHKNPSWMGVLWNATTSPEPHVHHHDNKTSG